jgi:hypothetical protein
MADVPSQTKRDFFILGATELEANVGGDAIGMQNNLRNVDLHIMSGIWVG